MRALCWALMLALTAGSATAQERIIRFGLTGDYPPFAEKGGDDRLAGADIVAARQVAAALGARAAFVFTTWTSLAQDFGNNRFDIAIGGLTVTPERAALGVFSRILLDDGKRPLARCADRRRYRTIKAIDRSGVRVQINRGPAIAVLARDWFPHATVVTNSDDATLVDALVQHRVDVWVTDGVVVDHMARRYPSVLCATTARPFNHVAKAWLIRRDPALVATVNTVLGRMMADGSWKAALRAVR